MKFSILAILLAASSAKSQEHLRGRELEPLAYFQVYGALDLCNEGAYNKCTAVATCPDGYKIQESGFSVFDCTDVATINSSNCNKFTGAIWTFKLVKKLLKYDGGTGPATGVEYTGTAENTNVALRAFVNCEEIPALV